jgi:hypothetical protein
MLLLTAMLFGCNESIENREKIVELEDELNLKDARIFELEEERRAIFGLSEELENQIKQDYYGILNNNSYTIEDVYIYRLYGMFDGGVGVKMALNGVSLPPAIDIITVEGFTFYFNTGQHIKIWKDGVFYSLQNAYDEGILTINDLEKIHDLEVK